MNEPVLLTVEVGHNIDTSEVNVQKPNDHLIRMSEVDELLHEYESELKKFGSATTDTTEPNLSLARADNERTALMDKLNQTFSVFLDQVRESAKRKTQLFSATNAAGGAEGPEPTIPIEDLLILDSVNAGEWDRKRHQILATMTSLEKRQTGYGKMVTKDVQSQKETSVGSHLAVALNQSLDENMANQKFDIDMISKVYGAQNNMMAKAASSYITFNSWILDNWNRAMQSIERTYEDVHSNIDKMFEHKRMHKDIEQLLTRYEKFLQVHEHLLPMEFTLSANPRKDWRNYMAQNQPEECIRLMKNELKSLDTIPQLQKSLHVWNRELNQYDIGRLQQMNEKKIRLKKRLEDAVDMETKRVCESKWNVLNQRVFKMGIGVQQSVTQKLNNLNQYYTQHHRVLLSKTHALTSTIYGYESKLALMDKPWAGWLEKRKATQREWVKLAYWERGIASLLNLYKIVSHFKTEFQKYNAATITKM